jgi:hypothetical protein
MGVVYKLKPEVKDFILKQKKIHPQLSCRSLAKLVREKFKTSLSKSSINFVLKEAGLSMPVGRRRKKSLRQAGAPKKIKPKLPAEEIAPEELKESEPIKPPAPVKPAEPAVAPKPMPEALIPLQGMAQEELVQEKQAQEKQAPEPQPKAEQPRIELPPLEQPQVEPPPVGPPPEEIIPEVKPEAAPPIVEKPTPKAMPLMPFETERQKEESPKAKQPKPIEPETLEIPTIKEGASFECPGAILLKAADYLIGGSFYFADAIRQYIRLPQAELLARTEAAIYLPLCEALKIDDASPCPWPFLYRVFNKEELFAYLFDLKNNKELTQGLKQLASHIFQEVRCVKINYADGSSLYLDGQLHTVWSTPHIPYSFVTPIQTIKNYINSCFFSSQPFVIFTAPGYDEPPKELFNFMLSFGSVEKRAVRMNIFGSRLEELGVVPLEEGKATHFVFGLWPWQFGHYRNILKLKEFKPFHEEMSKQDLYLAEIELELTQPELEQKIQLRGCALKQSPEDKIRFVILSNIWTKQTPEELVGLYLQRWPNLEESFQDYSRKIELFTYTASPSADIFSTENLNFESEQESEINMLFGNYLKILDTFVRTYFLPFGYEGKDFLATSERFYGLKATVQRQKEAVVVTFHPPVSYKFLADLTYACRRVNEREVVFPRGYRLWLQVAPLI